MSIVYRILWNIHLGRRMTKQAWEAGSGYGGRNIVNTCGYISKPCEYIRDCISPFEDRTWTILRLTRGQVGNYWMSDHTSQPNDAMRSKAQRSWLTFKTQKLMRGGQQIARPTAERWFWLTERYFLTRLVIHTYLTLSWFTAYRKWINCYFTSS